MFEAIEEEDRVVENEDGGNPALLGSCNDRAKQLHASPSGLHFKCAAVTLVVSKFSVIHKLQLISDAPMRMQPFFSPIIHMPLEICTTHSQYSTRIKGCMIIFPLWKL